MAIASTLCDVSACNLGRILSRRRVVIVREVGEGELDHSLQIFLAVVSEISEGLFFKIQADFLFVDLDFHVSCTVP